MIEKDFQQKIVEAVKSRLSHYESAAKMAVALGINGAQLSRILRGDFDKVLSDAKWISVARKLDVQLHAGSAWLAAKTPTYTHIYAQLQVCQGRALSGIMCDLADIGKTFTARAYVRENKGAVYIDCSQHKSKPQLIRAIAQEFGVGNSGRLSDVYEDLVFYLKTLPNPLIILDEAGDLSYPAFLELKALWNATEGYCGWYMMGADGLRYKIETNIKYRKVGYVELFSRFGSRYQRVTPEGREAFEDFQRTQVAMVAKVNSADADIKAIVAKTNGSLRRVRIELRKS